MSQTSASGARSMPTVLLGALVGLTLAVVLGACGIPSDSEPRAIDVVSQPALTPTPTAPPQTVTQQITIYLLDESTPDQPKVVGVQRDVEDASPKAIIDELIRGRNDELDPANLTSAIPPQTILLSAERELMNDIDVLVLDFEDPNDAPLGLDVAAVAQLVYTANELDDVDAVVVRVEGTDRGLPRPAEFGDADPGEPVTVADFVRFDPDAPPAPTPTPSPTAEPTPTLAPAPTATPVPE